MVFSSSATYYGSQAGPFKETDPPAPTSLYGASKVAAEAFIQAYASLYKLDACIFRFGNVVGGRMGHGVLFDFIQKLKANPKRLEIIGDGNQQRPFFLVDDCIEGMITASKYQCDIYNLACEDTTTINEVAQIVIDEMKLKDVEIAHLPAYEWDVPIVSLNIDKIKVAGWKPSHTSAEAARIAVQRLLQ
jgi:UDP-glucose 4-epimerase